MLCLLLSLFLVPGPLMQAPEGTGTDCLLPAERRQLGIEINLDPRIKIYIAASERCFGMVNKTMAQPNPPSISGVLDSWMLLLEESQRDIRKNSDRKKKSRWLIRYEIQLRKGIAGLEDLRMKGTYEDMQQIDTWVARAEAIHKEFVDILFQR
jgi:hypothetical protein